MSTRARSGEAAFLAQYDASLFRRPSVAIDTVIFTVIDASLHVLIVKRDEHPYLGYWSLVGGFIDIDADTDLEATAMRKLTEKTGVRTPYLEQFATVGNRTRDPRGWSVTTIYFALISANGVSLQTGKGATDIRWAPISAGRISERLAFDHADILHGCLERLRSKVLYTSLPVYLMPQQFTLGELQKTYEIILGRTIDHKSFRRRMLSVELLTETGESRHEKTRPAKLYRVRSGCSPHVFTRTIEASL